LDVLTTHVTVRVCNAELKSYTYLPGAKRLGGETSIYSNGWCPPVY